MHSGQTPRDTFLTESGLLVGFLALTVAIVLAHGSPTAGYELSIYAATPLSVWLSVGIALALALAVSVYTSDRRARWLGLTLASGAALVVVALPILRGYYYYGFGDALTHLGWARDIAAGELSPFELFYPGLHTVAVTFSQVLGLPLPSAMLLVVLCALLVYLLFVPLCIRELTDSRGALVVGVFAALLVLPVNHIAIHYMDPHPISEAILFSPLVLYLLARYATGRVGPVRAGVSVVSGLLALSLASIVVYHTMQAANLLAMFLAIVAVQVLAKRYLPESAIGDRPLYAHTAFLIAVFVAWNLQFTVVETTLSLVVDELAALFLGTAAPAAVVSSRSSSLSGLGASLGEIFLKLFLPSAVFAVLAAGVVCYSALRPADESLSPVRVFGIGLLGLVASSLPFLPGNVSKLLFRNVGFILVLGTILGSVALVWLFDSGEERSLLRRGAVTVVLAVLLVTSMAVVFPSPYIYHANKGVAETELQGYETAFEYRGADARFAGVRDGPQRQIQAIYGRQNVPADLHAFGYYRSEGALTGSELLSLPAAVEQPRYLAVTQQDRLRELEAYDSLRYTREQFDAVDSQRGVSRVLSNGPFTLYRVRPA